MTQKDLLERIVDELQMSKNEAERLFRSFLNCLKNILSEGNEVRLEGIGRFVPKIRWPRQANNNFRGERTVSKPGITVQFVQFDRSRNELLDLSPLKGQIVKEYEKQVVQQMSAAGIDVPLEVAYYEPTDEISDEEVPNFLPEVTHVEREKEADGRSTEQRFVGQAEAGRDDYRRYLAASCGGTGEESADEACERDPGSSPLDRGSVNDLAHALQEQD